MTLSSFYLESYMSLEIRNEDIGGARVRRTFNSNGRQLMGNEYLSAEEVLAIPVANRRALIDSSYIEVFPKANVGGERVMLSLGKDKGYNVIEGRMLNEEPLTREEAEKLVRAQQ